MPWSDLFTTNPSYFPLFGTIVNFSGGGGSGALAYAVISLGAVISVTMISGGTGYTSNPTPVFSGTGSGATGTAARTGTAVTSVSVTAGGSGYTTGAPVWILNFVANAWDTLINSIATWRDNVNANGKNLSNLGTLTFAGGGGLVQPTWNALSLSNSWVNAGGSNQVAQYCIDALGFVHVRGDIKSGTSADGTTLFTLPSGFRPPASMAYAVAGAFRAGPENVPQVNISSGGVATVYGLSSNSYLHIGPISFATF